MHICICPASGLTSPYIEAFWKARTLCQVHPPLPVSSSPCWAAGGELLGHSSPEHQTCAKQKCHLKALLMHWLQPSLPSVVMEELFSPLTHVLLSSSLRWWHFLRGCWRPSEARSVPRQLHGHRGHRALVAPGNVGHAPETPGGAAEPSEADPRARTRAGLAGPLHRARLSPPGCPAWEAPACSCVQLKTARINHRTLQCSRDVAQGSFLFLDGGSGGRAW